MSERRKKRKRIDDESFRLISWNMGGRVKTNPAQAEALAERQPNIAALQEVRLSALNHFKKLSPELNMLHIGESVHLVAEHHRAYLISTARVSYGRFVATNYR